MLELFERETKDNSSQSSRIETEAARSVHRCLKESVVEILDARPGTHSGSAVGSQLIWEMCSISMAICIHPKLELVRLTSLPTGTHVTV